MIDHDRLFKELISTFFLEFLELFLPAVRSYIEEGSLEFLDKEIFTDVTSGERHEVDLAVKLRFKGKETFFLVHVENQAHPQANYGKRMFRYFARLHEKHDLPVYPIAVFTYDAPMTEQPDLYQVEFPDRLVLDFHYQAIQLNRLSWRDFARRENPVASALMAKMKIALEDRAKVKLECIRLLVTLRLNKAKMQVILGFIDTYLGLDEAEEQVFQRELDQLAPIEKEGIMEGRMTWRERDRQEGRQEGRLEGRLEGRHEGMAAVITRLIERRVGPTDPATRERISKLNSDQLQSLGDAMLEFTAAEDLAKWLESN